MTDDARNQAIELAATCRSWICLETLAVIDPCQRGLNVGLQTASGQDTGV
ncbi:hypothetical protein ACFQ1S_06295 [Kibdelosporangium lantanae]|uniref:Uncharacterized protein n=1 Tax=Kibdelosporangium lantanae TaxID=1497396 RepID=A0ABW3M3M6_9PSEU